MKIPTTGLTIVLISSLSIAAVARADTMVITYRSGLVQHVAMDRPSKEVKDIGYLKTAVPWSEKKPKELSNKHVADGVGKVQSDSEKKGVTIKWAPPIDQ